MKTNDEPFTMEFIYDLHGLVGIDAVTEFHKVVKEYQPHREQEYIKALKEYYDTRYWEKYDNI